MLSLFRRSVLQSQRAVLCRTQQRVASLSYTVVGEERRSTVATEATSAATGASEAPPQPESTEFDSDAEDFVTKEVSILDRQHKRFKSSAEAVKQQEDDYSSPRDDDASSWSENSRGLASADNNNKEAVEKNVASAEGTPPPFFDAYEPPLTEEHSKE